MTTNAVTEVPAASSALAVAHFAERFTFETDCSDVHEAMASGNPGFILVDVRSPKLYAEGHVPGAINIPHGKLTAERLSAYPKDTLFVTYCAGPHCNGATKGALRLARLGRPVKEMIGGIAGWEEQGYDLTDTEITTD
jgi:rhodanese-related sulfurtransferase